jgi:hypothetical protein
MNMNRFLEVNVGKLDKVIRLILVIICILLALMLQNYWFFLGILPLFSVLTGRCPVYSVLGIRTCPIEKKS